MFLTLFYSWFWVILVTHQKDRTQKHKEIKAQYY